MPRLKLPPVNAKSAGAPAKPKVMAGAKPGKPAMPVRTALSAKKMPPVAAAPSAGKKTNLALASTPSPQPKGNAGTKTKPAGKHADMRASKPAGKAAASVLVPPFPVPKKQRSSPKPKVAAAPVPLAAAPVPAKQPASQPVKRKASSAGLLAKSASLVSDVVATLNRTPKAVKGGAAAPLAGAAAGKRRKAGAAAVPDPVASQPSPTAEPAPSSNAEDKPAVLAGLQPLLALGVAEGLFVIVAARASLEPLRAFARYEAEPLPRFTGDGGYFNVLRSPAGSVVYTGFVPWPGVPAGAVQLGCITESERKPLLAVNSLSFADLPPQALATLRARFGRVLLPAALAALPASHPLCAPLQPGQLPAVPAQTAVRCHFDGAIDGLAHGWVYDPAQPGKAFLVEVLHEDVVVARGMADLYRDDLERNGIGNGHHHFKLSLSYTLLDGQPHVLSIRVPELGAAGLCPPVTCTLEASQPSHLDAIPRAQALVLALELARRSASYTQEGEQALLSAFEQSCLQQETWLLEEARAGFLRLAETHGANALCHCKVAETWLLDHHLGRAMESYSAAVQCDPRLAWAHLGLGNVQRMQGHPLAAQQSYRAALACAPELVQAELRLASVHVDALVASAVQLAQAGDKAGAIALLRPFVFEHPDDEAACNGLDVLLREEQTEPRAGEGRSFEPAARADRARRLLDAMLDEAEQRLANAAATP